MNELQLILAIVTGIALLLVLIIKVKLNAFLSLLIASIWVGLIGGLSPDLVVGSIKKGMGDTLAFVATIVGLGAIFGALLENSGGAQALAKYLIKKGGEQKSRLALLVTGFIVSIPVFFDVGIIILFPIVKALARRIKKNVLYFALPLLTGLGVTHSFIPPTPGPVAVADILKVDIGYAIIVGILIGLPVALVCGLVFAKWITPDEIDEPADGEVVEEVNTEYDPGLVKTIFRVLGIPIGLILIGSLIKTLLKEGVIGRSGLVDLFSFMGDGMTGIAVDVCVWFGKAIVFLGDPIIALILATLMALHYLGTKRGLTRKALFDVSNRSLGPAGSIILITGAGGVLKQMMITTGIGDLIGQAMQESAMSVVVLAYLVAVLVRIMQGSATVAMLTAAGIVSAVITGMDYSMMDKTLIMMAIAAGSIVMSHVNDSGFWLVNRYLNHSVQQTLRSWTIQSTMISVTSFILIFTAYILL